MVKGLVILSLIIITPIAYAMLMVASTSDADAEEIWHEYEECKGN